MHVSMSPLCPQLKEEIHKLKAILPSELNNEGATS
jgi:hypothetical protein